MNASRVLCISIVFLAFAFNPALTLADDTGPADTVRAFNAGISAKDRDAAVATLAEGGAQFTLRSQHGDAPPDRLQSEISEYWTIIAPVLFASTSAYRREVEILDTRIDGDLATVWTHTRTRSTRLGSTKPQVNTFSEVYLLIRTPDGWKIAAMADNRKATSLGK